MPKSSDDYANCTVEIKDKEKINVSLDSNCTRKYLPSIYHLSF